MSAIASPFGAGLQQVAATAAAGAALQNGTPTFASWTAPNDGQPHTFQVIASLLVSSLETGGQVVVTFTTPDGTAASANLFSAGLAAGANGADIARLCQPGTTVSVKQGSALTGGAATLWVSLRAM